MCVREGENESLWVCVFVYGVYEEIGPPPWAPSPPLRGGGGGGAGRQSTTEAQTALKLVCMSAFPTPGWGAATIVFAAVGPPESRRRPSIDLLPARRGEPADTHRGKQMLVLGPSSRPGFFSFFVHHLPTLQHEAALYLVDFLPVFPSYEEGGREGGRGRERAIWHTQHEGRRRRRGREERKEGRKEKTLSFNAGGLTVLISHRFIGIKRSMNASSASIEEGVGLCFQHVYIQSRPQLRGSGTHDQDRHTHSSGRRMRRRRQQVVYQN